MATYRQKITAERKVRELLANEGLPLPDRIEYGEDCIRLLWIQQKVCMVVDINDMPPDVTDDLVPQVDVVRGEG